ncbi:juvenile hormone acid O-methyltransferase [Microplitis mediator]|uniref:juvenile hormone acid O-methyltransferase n=1 Tax=Microplitis mediator TaxID=375433 RepID=UPI0025543758|nr:juvenile hormone acid O-methyltransferase [Microplitis mediator]
MDSKKYIDGFLLQRRDASEVIEEFSDELSSMYGKCIDIGCGPGNITKELILPKLPADSVVVGADISESMIDSAKKKYQDEERLSFIKLNIEAEELPIKEIERYDNVLSFYCLHWCQNMRLALKNIHQLLRPGGRALVMFLSYNNGFDAYKRLQRNPRYKPYMEDVLKYIPAYHSCPNPRAMMKKTLEEVGFEVLHCSNREKTFVFESMEILQKHIIAVNPFINRIPDELKDEYKMEVTREIAEHKILFESHKNKSGYSVLDRYALIIAYFRKPNIL